MRRRRTLAACVVALAVVGAATLAVREVYLEPHGRFPSPVQVELRKGMTTSQIAAELAGAGVVPTRWHFLLVRLMRRRSNLQAGEYEFREPATVWNVYSRIARGDVVRYALTVTEGSNTFDIARLLDEQGILDGAQFRRVAESPRLIRDLAPEAKTLEGFLFPSTYYLTRSTSPLDLASEMTHQFRKVWKKIGGHANVYSTVTLASLVEKETAVAGERPVVASVYANRLEKGMLLQCDPTVIYAALLDGAYQGTIYQSTLESGNPYNTYRHPGLPPGPIANPGEASLKAALHPADTQYLYFVARPGGNGTHVFSKDLAAHELAVRRYRRASRK